MKKYVCIHGHFYQPPRENPWLEEVELQDSAQPFHDWNHRIAAECYGPNAISRILDSQQRIVDIVNNYSMISYNFGPTLLSWLERHMGEVYQAVVGADQESRERFSGFGSAVAQVYNHMIMPLAGERDKRTQAKWGIADFEHRFGRKPEGMWLPETAVDLATLEVLADLGIRFTILAPRQASRVRPLDGDDEDWQDVSDSRIDPTRAYLCRLPSGKEMNLFFYDGPISQELAFGDMLNSGDAFRDRIMAAFDDSREHDQLVHVATDGETYGHHHSQAEMALSWALYLIDQDPEVEVVNYPEFLDNHPPEMEAEIFENSSWSCIHGVERWRADCGCNSGMHQGWNQAWREPLRRAVDWLGRRAEEIFEEQGARYLKDPWAARDDYIRVILDRSPETIQAFFAEHGKNLHSPMDIQAAIKLLEMERFAMLIFTSCAWFFDEISGIETVQIMQYAVRCIQLAEELGGEPLEEDFQAMLAEAPSNVFENGAKAFEKFAKPARVDMLRVAADYAISSAFEDYPDEHDLTAYTVIRESENRVEAGRSLLLTGRARITSRITMDSAQLHYAVLHPGDHNLTCGVGWFEAPEAHREMERDLAETFERGDLTDSIRKLDEHFGRNTYSIWHLFRDAQRRVVNRVLEPAYRDAENAYRSIYDTNYHILSFLDWLGVPTPSQFLDAAAHVVNADLKALFSEDRVDVDRVEALVEESRKLNLGLDRQPLAHLAAGWMNDRARELEGNPQNLELLENMVRTLKRLTHLPLGMNFWRAQNVYFRLGRDLVPAMREGAERGEDHALKWTRRFDELGELLKVKLP